MQWTDEAIILGTRRHGETSLIAELLTRGHGRHLGLIRGGRSRRLQPLLQPGNGVSATWRARLDEHLGNLTVESTVARAARLMESGAGVFGVQAVAALVRLLPEREAHPRLYEHAGAILDAFDDAPVAAALLARFEVRLLEDLGFGLDLDTCAVTGANDDLAYVSPRTGRAVTRSAGEPYAARLFPLPAFLLDGPDIELPSAAEVGAAFRMTGHFLERHVFIPRGQELPAARTAFLTWLERAAPGCDAA